VRNLPVERGLEDVWRKGSSLEFGQEGKYLLEARCQELVVDVEVVLAKVDTQGSRIFVYSLVADLGIGICSEEERNFGEEGK